MMCICKKAFFCIWFTTSTSNSLHDIFWEKMPFIIFIFIFQASDFVSEMTRSILNPPSDLAARYHACTKLLTLCYALSIFLPPKYNFFFMLTISQLTLCIINECTPVGFITLARAGACIFYCLKTILKILWYYSPRLYFWEGRGNVRTLWLIGQTCTCTAYFEYILYYL